MTCAMTLGRLEDRSLKAMVCDRSGSAASMGFVRQSNELCLNLSGCRLAISRPRSSTCCWAAHDEAKTKEILSSSLSRHFICTRAT
jgi:hypothetical protein